MYIKEIFEKATIQGFADYLLFGLKPDKDDRDYKTRLDDAYQAYDEVVGKYDENPNSELINAVGTLASEISSVYTEIGLRAGILLMEDVFRNLEGELTVNYPKRTGKLKKENIQRTMEELYLPRVDAILKEALLQNNKYQQINQHVRDMDTGQYVYKYQTPKTKNSIRKIPMQDSVYKALKRQRVQIKEMQMVAYEWETMEGFKNLVFAGKSGNPVPESSFNVALKGIKKSIDKERERKAKENETTFEPIPHFYPHAFRHTFATRCFEAGIDAKVVQGYLGHYSISITLDLYTHITDDKARTEMNKLQSLYQEIV